MGSMSCECACANEFDSISIPKSDKLDLRRRKAAVSALEKAVAGLAHEIVKLESDINGTLVSRSTVRYQQHREGGRRVF